MKSRVKYAGHFHDVVTAESAGEMISKLQSIL